MYLIVLTAPTFLSKGYLLLSYKLYLISYPFGEPETKRFEESVLLARDDVSQQK